MALIGIVIPTNIFVYGTSDTSYVNTVSSIIEVNGLQISSSEEESTNSKISSNNDESNETLVSSEVADALGVEYSEEDSMSLILADELAQYNIVLISKEDTESLEEKYEGLNGISTAELNDYSTINLDESVSVSDDAVYDGTSPVELVTKEDLKSYSGPGDEYSIVAEYTRNIKISVTAVEKDGYVLVNNDTLSEWINKEMLCTQEEYIKSLQGDALIDISNPDTSYSGQSVSLTAEDRDLLERLVMGEAGNTGYEGAALVAQCIRDTMLYKGYDSVAAVRKSCKYSGTISLEPNQNVKDAVSFIFDDGGYAVRHKIIYFYAPKYCSSSWHEAQTFIVEYGGHRFFC